MMPWLLTASLGGLAYIYAGYPLLAALLGAVRRRGLPQGGDQPKVSIVIAAYNEATSIAATIENKLALDWPHDRLEIVVVSDGSSDGTDEIVRSFADRGVRLLRQEPRAGKTSALNLALASIDSPLVAFSDANSIWDRGALRALVAPFASAEVGYVTGKLVYVTVHDGVAAEGCSAYMRYENKLREFETQLGSIVGVDGGIDAVRRELYRPMRPDQLPDFVLPLDVVMQGKRVVFAPAARQSEEAPSASRDEYRMRVRVSLRALWALWDKRALFNPLRYPLFAWQLLSHKLLRYLGLFFMLAALASNIAVYQQSRFLAALLALQLAAWVAVGVGLLLERWRLPLGPLRLGCYLTLVNLAAAHAVCKFLAGKKQVLWAPRRG